MSNNRKVFVVILDFRNFVDFHSCVLNIFSGILKALQNANILLLMKNNMERIGPLLSSKVPKN